MLIYSSMAEADYYKHVDEVTAEPDHWVDKHLKIHGFVEPGSIDEKIVGESTVRTFVLEYKGERIHVTHKGPKPDTFRDLAEVVGTRTYGKGTFQELLDLPDGGALDLTIGEYLTADGTSILGEGVKPDVRVAADPRGRGDPQLDRALRVLGEQIAADQP